MYTSLVERSLASNVSGVLVPTAQPFLYTISMTAMQGVSLPVLESAALEALDRVREGGVTEEEAARARRQLRARFVFETDSVTNIAHQLGYFETVTGPGFFDRLQSSVARVTAAEVSEVGAPASAGGESHGRLVPAPAGARAPAVTTTVTRGLSPVGRCSRVAPS